MDIEIPIQGQSASGGVPPIQPPVPPVQPPTPPNQPNYTRPIEPPPIVNNPYDTGNTNMFPSNSRMIEDVRREMQQRGVLMVPGSSSMSQIINQYGSNLRQQKVDEIKSDFGQRGQVIVNTRDRELNELQKWGNKEYTRLYHLYGDDEEKAKKSQEYQELKDKYTERKDAIENKYASGITTLKEEQDEEISEVDKELTRAVRDLTRYFEREAQGNVNKDSYLGQLRKQREEAIFERDNADDEEQAREASRRANELEDKIKSVISEGNEGEETTKKDFGARVLQMMTGVNQFVGGLSSHNLGSIITGTGGLITNMLPLSDENQATSMKWLTGAGLIGSLIQNAVEKEDAMAGLAALTRENGQSIADKRRALAELGSENLYAYRPRADLPSIFGLGMDEMSFANSAERRISQRGIGGQKGIVNAYYQEAMERALSLSAGSLGAAGQFDIYGTNSTEGFAALMKGLENAKYSRISRGNYAASEQYLQMQQGIMQSQLGFTASPNYDYANRMLSILENQKSYIADSRTIGDVQALQGMVQNPQNDRQKAILYGVIEKMYPSTRGRMDLIQRKLQDPNVLPQIYKGYMQEIQKMYGGSNTEMGYFALQSLLPGVGSAQRRDEIMDAILNQNSVKKWNSLRGNDKVSNWALEYSKMADDYHSDLSRVLTETTDGIYTLLDSLVGLVKDLIEFVKHPFGL